MEEEKIEVKVQEDEVEDERACEECKVEIERENRQSLRRMAHG